MLSYGDTLIYYHLKYNSLGNVNRIHGICNSVVYLYSKEMIMTTTVYLQFLI